jgi:hypothetical protein
MNAWETNDFLTAVLLSTAFPGARLARAATRLHVHHVRATAIAAKFIQSIDGLFEGTL